MHPTILAYIQAKERLRIAREKVDSSLAVATEEACVQCALRPATAKDITIGNIIWSEGDNGLFWSVVEDVLNPNDPFKAFVAHDGCRYGLSTAFVEE